MKDSWSVARPLCIWSPSMKIGFCIHGQRHARVVEESINLEEEAGKLNKEIWDACKLKFDAVLKSTGISSKGAPTSAPPPDFLGQADGEQCTALAKLQASNEASTRRLQATENALKQKERAINNKIEAFKAAKSSAYQN